MARTYRLSTGARAGNRLMSGFLRLGLGPRSTYLLTVTGRRSGLPRTTPVTLVERDDGRWLVAPYGPVGWVHNARAAGRVTLRRGGHVEEVRIREVEPAQAAPILKHYVTAIRLVRPYFDVPHDAPVDAFAAEALRHPVFEVQGPVEDR